MKKRSSFKDIQRFKEIASILDLTYEESESFCRLLDAKTPEQNYEAMLKEIEAEKMGDAS